MTCPICGSTCELLDVMDFDIRHAESAGKRPPLSGRPIYYSICGNCAFTFSPEMHGWSTEEFSDRVYNDEYVAVDPDYIEVRPRANATMVENLFGSKKHALTHIDYGGGSGKLSAILRDAGWNSSSYDPFDPNSDRDIAGRNYDLITAFEVFEHVADVNNLMLEIQRISSSQSLILFSTLLSDGHIKPHSRLNWWYASPRNGHISLFSRMSLAILAERYHLKFVSFNPGMHVFFDTLPAWASHLMRAA